MTCAGQTAWRTWLKCLNPAQTLPRAFHPYIQLQSPHTAQQAQHTAQQAQHTAAELLLPRPCTPSLFPLATDASFQVAAFDSGLSSNLVHSQRPQSAKQQNQLNDFAICIGGWLFSCVCAALLQVLQNHIAYPVSTVTKQRISMPEAQDTWQAVLLFHVTNGFWVTAAASLGSDVFQYGFTATGHTGARSFHCGNFGIMLADACGQTLQMVQVKPSLSLC